MFALPQNFLVRSAIVCLLVVLLLMSSLTPLQAGSNPLMTLFVAIMTGTIGLVIYDLLSCQLNWLFYADRCRPGDDGIGGDGSAGGRGGGNRNFGRPGGRGNDGAGGSGGGIGTGNLCQVPNPVCPSIVSIGKLVDGVCDATPPANSECPAPDIGDVGFYAEPERVRSGNTATLHWDVTNATVCALVGGGLSLPLIEDLTGEQETNEIEEATVYTLTCWNGEDGPQTSQQTTVTLIPAFEEI